MNSQKLENLLNLALDASEQEREKSLNLDAGYDAETERWELIVKYNGDLKRLDSTIIYVEELIAGYAIVTIPFNKLLCRTGRSGICGDSEKPVFFFTAGKGSILYFDSNGKGTIFKWEGNINSSY